MSLRERNVKTINGMKIRNDSNKRREFKDSNRLSMEETFEEFTKYNDTKEMILSNRIQTYTSNKFRAATGNTMEHLLLYQEQPRQLIALGSALFILVLYPFPQTDHDDQQYIRNGLVAGVFIFLLYCFLQTRDGLMVRPHPGLWRIVHGCSVVYLLLLTALSVQKVQDAINGLRILFPEAGTLYKPSPNEISPLDCAINANTVYRGVSSIWFLAHVLGWWGKMCLFRDWRMCWVLSIAFEFLELGLQFIIPDFQECWWDSLFMDLFGANLIGMIVGRYTLSYVESKEYDWSGRQGQKMGVFLLAIQQFTPLSWSQYQWQVFSSVKRFTQVIFLIFVCLSAELNAFFLLNTLRIPKESNFHSYRLTLMFLLGIPSAAEYYEFISNPECERLGQNAWLMLSITVLEILVWVRFSYDENGKQVLITKAPPLEVYAPVLAFITLFSIWAIGYFFIQKRKISKKPTLVRQSSDDGVKFVPIHTWGLLDVLFWISFLPLLALITQWAF